MLAAYTARGLCRLKLDGRARGGSGIEDLNRGISGEGRSREVVGDNYSAFLLRAAHYGKEGRFSKAILNCNEALVIQPRSLRALVCRGALKFRIQSYRSVV